MSNFKQNVRTDRFGNPYMLKTAEAVTSKQGETLNVYKTFIEVGGKLIKLEISERHKETRSGKPAMWVKATSVTKRQRNSASF